MMNLEALLKAYETDAANPAGLGRFEVLNMLTNRDALEEQRSKLTTLQAARLLFADEKLATNSGQIISECGGAPEFVKLRQHNPMPSAWWWFLEQISAEQFFPAETTS
ncbi:hypothetical protein HUU39_13100 [candidate division KSB1 bacterium]|nr:hypothetical protein [bacterium]NUM66199.1 hypothetical protein [candidate division KSB1 bacterium]